MLQLPKSATDSNGVGTNNSHSEKPGLILLDEKQWSYVQNRYSLTRRERQIAELICQGLRNGGIAKLLRIKLGTVKTHTRNIYRKVKVKSKIAMLLRFVTDVREISCSFDQSE